MRNIKLEIEYEGTNYCGWQAQSIRQSHKAQGTRHKSQGTSHKKKAIQEVIEDILQKILQEKIRLIASGRTDAGVHALAQVANFKTNSAISLEKLQKALNGLLPDDIVITNIEEEDLEFHSRFLPKSKIYRYTILNRRYPSAILRGTVYFYPYPLNARAMRKESRVLLGRHNFKSFQATNKLERSSIRVIKSIGITKNRDLLHIEIEGSGFLHNMVRNIVGTLIEIGRGKIPPESLKKILLAKDRRFAGPTAPAKGLCLIKVKY